VADATDTHPDPGGGKTFRCGRSTPEIWEKTVFMILSGPAQSPQPFLPPKSSRRKKSSASQTKNLRSKPKYEISGLGVANS
jgi:hypothetical protein